MGRGHCRCEPLRPTGLKASLSLSPFKIALQICASSPQNSTRCQRLRLVSLSRTITVMGVIFQHVMERDRTQAQVSNADDSASPHARVVRHRLQLAHHAAKRSSTCGPSLVAVILTADMHTHMSSALTAAAGHHRASELVLIDHRSSDVFDVSIVDICTGDLSLLSCAAASYMDTSNTLAHCTLGNVTCKASSVKLPSPSKAAAPSKAKPSPKKTDQSSVDTPK